MDYHMGQAQANFPPGGYSDARPSGVADLNQETLNCLHQARELLDTLIERVAGPEPKPPSTIEGSTHPVMGVRQVAQMGVSVASDVLARINRLRDLI